MSLKNRILYRLPMLKTENCPFCGDKITQKKEGFLLVKNERGTKQSFYPIIVPYCPKCHIPYANALLLNKTRYELNMQPNTFTSKHKKNTIKEIERVPHSIQEQLGKYEKLCFPIIEECGHRNQEIIRIICNHSFGVKCPHCVMTMEKKDIHIPVTIAHKAIMRGAYCSCCDRFFTNHSAWSIRQLIENNPLAEQFIFDEKDPYDERRIEELHKHEEYLKKKAIQAEKQRRKEAEEKRKEEEKARLLQKAKEEENKAYFESNPTIVVILYAEFPDGIRTIRIADKNAKESREENIYKYDSETGREYLSAGFAPARNGKGRIDGQEFRITETFRSLSGAYTGNQIGLKQRMITIERDGGNYTSVFHNHDCVLADLLLYSPFTKRLEIMPSTYNKRKKYCFTDIRHFREFVQKFGKPDVLLDFDTYGGSDRGMDWENLRAQSILNAYGYNVNKNEDLPTTYRHDLLAEVADLDILDIRSICDYLDFFISTHPQDKYEDARAKWAEDLDFIANYNYNPERFLIAGGND